MVVLAKEHSPDARGALTGRRCVRLRHRNGTGSRQRARRGGQTSRSMAHFRAATLISARYCDGERRHTPTMANQFWTSGRDVQCSEPVRTTVWPHSARNALRPWRPGRAGHALATTLTQRGSVATAAAPGSRLKARAPIPAPKEFTTSHISTCRHCHLTLSNQFHGYRRLENEVMTGNAKSPRRRSTLRKRGPALVAAWFTGPWTGHCSDR